MMKIGGIDLRPAEENRVLLSTTYKTLKQCVFDPILPSWNAFERWFAYAMENCNVIEKYIPTLF